MDLCWQSNVSALSMLSRFGTTFLPRSKCLLISWLQSPSPVILEPKQNKTKQSVTISTVSPSICHEVMGLDAMILVLWMLTFKQTFSLSSFTFLKRPFSSFSLSANKSVQGSPEEAWVGGTECISTCMVSFEGGHLYLHYLHHSLKERKWSCSVVSNSLQPHGL